MSEVLLNRPCVRVSIYEHDQKLSHGSGTLVKGLEDFFVITAYHCVFGIEDQFVKLGVDSIIIEFQETYNSSFNLIPVLEVVASDKDQDWVVLKVQFDDTNSEFPEIMVVTTFKKDMPVNFTGFQSFNEEEGRTFKCRVLNEISRGEFRITLAEQDTFKGGADDALGLSGSGAFIVHKGKLYLIGILKSVKGDEAANNDIKCCPMTQMIDYIGLQVFEISKDVTSDFWGSDMFGTLSITDIRDLTEKLKSVNRDISERRTKRYCKDLALGKSELSNLLERDLSAIKYRIFEACQTELVAFIDQNNSVQLSNDEIDQLIARFTKKAIDIISIKSKVHQYPMLDDDLIRKLVLDLINECYLSFDEKGIYAE